MKWSEMRASIATAVSTAKDTSIARCIAQAWSALSLAKDSRSAASCNCHNKGARSGQSRVGEGLYGLRNYSRRRRCAVREYAVRKES